MTMLSRHQHPHMVDDGGTVLVEDGNVFDIDGDYVDDDNCIARLCNMGATDVGTGDGARSVCVCIICCWQKQRRC